MLFENDICIVVQHRDDIPRASVNKEERGEEKRGEGMRGEQRAKCKKWKEEEGERMRG